ncbi:MAG: M1 family aminopeptidase [Bryobacteraceae bacterium]
MITRRLLKTALRFILTATIGLAAGAPDVTPNVTPETIADQLQHLSLDASQTFRVRELQLSRAGVKIYLAEGLLSFLTPVGGQVVGAVFTTQGVDAGDGEILALPPNRAERASLAAFTKSPNLDEHFASALLLFTDATAAELREQIQQRPLHPEPGEASQMAVQWENLVRSAAAGLNVRLTGSLLDGHQPADGFFYAFVAGRTLGPFEFTDLPEESEPVTLGRPPMDKPAEKSDNSNYQLWTQYRQPNRPAPAQPPARIEEYRIDTTIHPDLSLSSVAKFRLSVSRNTRAVALNLSGRLRIRSATVDGSPVEVMQPKPIEDATRPIESQRIPVFLLLTPTELKTAQTYQVEISYEGSVISETSNGSYFVGDRNGWFPHAGPSFANFDLTFHCPESLHLVSTGELVSDQVLAGVRTVHRRSLAPERFAGFNLGNYTSITESRGPYLIECDANQAFTLIPKGAEGALTLNQNLDGSQDTPARAILNETGNLLEAYSSRWGALPMHDIIVAPIPGYFGQGFPGLIYLSTMSFINQADRPKALQTAAIDTFFSEMLLPHETAHQWWGNVISPADYRTDWLMEAMASESALEVLADTKGPTAVAQILALYKHDLLEEVKGRTTESAGPVDFGYRLEDDAGHRAWQAITYEKGAWVLWMLRNRMGADAFTKMQAALLHRYADHAVTNDDFRKVAAEFLPPHTPDPSLQSFFDSWIFGTGIPALTLDTAGHRQNLKMSGVDDDFEADIPLSCTSKAGAATTYWIRASPGDNAVEPPEGSSSCQLPATDVFLYR